MADVRWDGDARGRGVGDAAAFAEGASELVDAMRSADWVAEKPELHLLPHLRAACDNLPFELATTRVLDDGRFEVDLTWTGGPGGVGEVRRAVYALIGAVAESATYVRQHRDHGSLAFELATGLIGEDAHFAPHGHTVRFRIELG
jgi:hypothetical protein